VSGLAFLEVCSLSVRANDFDAHNGAARGIDLSFVGSGSLANRNMTPFSRLISTEFEQG